MLFATLDPTSGRSTLPSGQQVVVTDTVGFINKLLDDLVDAFRAMLEEVLRADLLLEVVDASDADFVGQQAAVQTVLDELGAGECPDHRVEQGRPAGGRRRRACEGTRRRPSAH